MIAFENISKIYGGEAALEDISFTVAEGAFCVVLGRSGSGKSTLLRLVNRLVEPSSGRVLLAGEDVLTKDAATLRRQIGYVIQSVGLFPHWRVRDNIATVPRLLGWEKERIAERCDALLDLVGLPAATYAERYPHELSGGQAQRVGLARALAADPPLLLMDEPFSSLDPATRRALGAELRALHGQSGRTILFVTHDVEEALILADELVILDKGRMVVAGPPERLLSRPLASEVVALFGQEALAFHKLATLSAAEAAGPLNGHAAEDAPLLAEGASLKDALFAMLSHGTDRVRVPAKGAEGRLTFASLLERL